MAILAFCGSVFVFAQLLRSIAQGSQRFRLISAIQALWGGLWLLGAAVATQYSYEMLLLVWTAIIGVTAFTYAIFLRPVPLRWDRAVFRLQMRFGLRSLGGSIARALNLRYTLYVVAAMLQPANVGVYSVLLALSEAFLYVPNALSQVVLGRSAAPAATSSGDRHAYYAVVLIGVGAIVVAAGAGRLLLSTVFGPEYAAGASALVIMMFAVSVQAVGLVRVHRYYGEGDAAPGTRAQVFGLAGLVVSAPFLVAHFGVAGAALGSLIGQIMFTAALFVRPPSLRQLRSRVSGAPAAAQQLPDYNE